MKTWISGRIDGTRTIFRGMAYLAGLIAFFTASSTAWGFLTAQYLPLTRGNAWAYQLNAANNVNTAVQFPEYSFNGVLARAVSNSGDDTSTTYVTNDANGIIYQAEYEPAVPVEGVGNVPATLTFTPGLKVAQADAFVGQIVPTAGNATFSYGPPLNTDVTLQFSATSTIAGFETVIVPAGTFNTLKVVTVVRIYGLVGATAIDQTTTDTTWLAQNVGLIKQISSDSSSTDTILLKSYLVPALSPSSRVVKFGVQPTGTASAPRSVTLTSAGTVDVTSPFIFPSGSDFNMVANTCGNVVPVGTGCMLSFTFTPGAQGIRTGRADVTISNDYTMPQPISLIGGLAGKSDFHADGRSGILWRESASGLDAIWRMNGTTLVSSALIPTVSAPGWIIAGEGDFNGDGKADILWRNTMTGDNAIWLMNGFTLISSALIPSVPTTWAIAGVADFNGDGKADILWRESASGLNAIWQMDGVTLAGSALIPSVTAPGWTIAGVGDLDGDAKADILWRNTTTGDNALWLMNGFTVASSALIPSVPTTWAIAGVTDYDGDGKLDILWRESSGQNAIWLMNGSTVANSALIPGVSAAGWTIVGVGDYNGDGKADILWRDTGTGSNAIWLMNGTALFSSALIPSVPTSWNIVNTR